jgi:hypothetical protein
MLVDAVRAALAVVEAEGATADVVVRLARRIDVEGASPSSVRECRYALVSLGVTELEPYAALMQATKAAIDRSDLSLPTLAAQLRETEQLCRRLSSEPVNAPLARSVRAAVDGIVALWDEAWADWLAGREHDWAGHRERENALWRTIKEAGDGEVFPSEVGRAMGAWDAYWQGRRRARGLRH